MEAKSKDTENKCACNGKKTIKAFCERCKMYICMDCHVLKHLDHDSEVIDLAEKATRFLSEYQKLSRAAIFMADRRQVHIKDESIAEIIEEIKDKIIKARDALQGDINNATDANTKYLIQSPLVQEFIHKKKELEGKTDDPLHKIKIELTDVCKNILQQITDGKLETADKLISVEHLKKYEEEVAKLTNETSKDIEYIQETFKLRQTMIDYSYNPMSILGMIKVKTNVKKPDRVVQFNREKNQLNILNIRNNKLTSTTLSSGFILPFRFVSIEACNNLYLIGGDNDKEYFLKSLYIYDELRGSLMELAHMQEARSRHAAVELGEKAEIYVIGGDSSKGPLKSCEKYDIKNNEWKSMPDLNNKRCGLSACICGKTIYAICGWNQDYLDSIEKLDLSKADGDWETVKLAKKTYMNKLQVPGVFPIKEEEILIFGGYKEDEVLSNECLILDTKSHTIKKPGKLPEPEAFISSEIKKVGDSIYAFGYDKGGVYTYNMAKDEWTFTAQDKIPQ